MYVTVRKDKIKIKRPKKENSVSTWFTTQFKMATQNFYYMWFYDEINLKNTIKINVSIMLNYLNIHVVNYLSCYAALKVHKLGRLLNPGKSCENPNSQNNDKCWFNPQNRVLQSQKYIRKITDLEQITEYVLNLQH